MLIRLCAEVRDLSMNGTGLKLGDDKPAARALVIGVTRQVQIAD